MFSENAANIIQALPFDSQAEMISCLLPLGSIFWSDELPPLRFLAFTEGADRDAVMRLFAIRISYWNKGEMSAEEELFWDAAQKQFPEWSVFRRLNLSEAHRHQHERVQKQAEEFFDEMVASADEIELSKKEGGFTSFSATFNLDDE